MKTNGEPIVAHSDGTAIRLRRYNDCELAVLYNISRPTFRKWTAMHKDKIGKRNGYYYSVKQVKVMFEIFGLPESLEADPQR